MTETERKLTDALVAIEIHLKDAGDKLEEANNRSGEAKAWLCRSALGDIRFSQSIVATLREDV